MEDLKYCIDCKSYHSQISRKVKIKGYTIGEICDDCNKKRIFKLLNTP